MLGNITTKLAAQEVRMHDLTSHVVVLGVAVDVQPGPSHYTAERGRLMIAVKVDQDLFHRMEEQVHHSITERLKGVPPAYLPTTDNDSGADDTAPVQPRKKHKGTSSKLRTADTTVVNQVV